MAIIGKSNIKNKVYRLVKKTVPFRQKYRPRGVIYPEKMAKECSGAEHVVVYDRYETILPLPSELACNLSSYLQYDELIENQAGGQALYYKDRYEIVVIPNGRLYSNNISVIALMTSKGEVIERVSYQYNENRRVGLLESDLLKQKYFPKPKYIQGTVATLLAGYGATVNIAHWLFDSIPRIHLLKKAGVFESIDYFIVPAYALEYHRYTLEKLGIREHQVIVGEEDVHVISDRLVATSHPRGDRSMLIPKWSFDFVRSSFLESSKGVYERRRIYISREDSRLRRVLNEEEVVSLLKSYGFEVVRLSEISFKSQVVLFSQSEIIVSSHGAGLSKLFFASSGSTLIELFSKGFVNTAFYNLAYWGDLKYYPLVFDSDSPASSKVDGMNEDVLVDLEVLEDTLLRCI